MSKQENQIYLDNGSTSFPKAPGVGDSMLDFIKNNGCNINRGGYEKAYDAGNKVFETRELLCKLFRFSKESNVIFTSGVTESLNCIIHGFLKSGDHVLVSSLEHNAVMRPLVASQKNGITFDRIACDLQGNMDISDLKTKIQTNTKAIILTHASNVCGTIHPITQIGRICKEYGVKFILDTSQSAGILDIDMHRDGIDALTFTGHKGLLGPQGIGGFLVTDEMAQATNPMILGGTGSISDSEEMPLFLPDKFEAGTPNLPGIFGLHSALTYLLDQGSLKIYKKEMTLTGQLLKSIGKLSKESLPVKIIGNPTTENRVGIVSLDFIGQDNGEIADRLDQEFGIMTRCGLHCAPYAHKSLGTFPQGTVRIGIGHRNTPSEIDYLCESILKIINS